MTHGSLVPSGSRAVRSKWHTGRHYPLAHRPSVRTWLTGRQSPVGTRAVSPRVSPGSSGSRPVGHRGLDPSRSGRRAPGSRSVYPERFAVRCRSSIVVRDSSESVTAAYPSLRFGPLAACRRRSGGNVSLGLIVRVIVASPRQAATRRPGSAHTSCRAGFVRAGDCGLSESLNRPAGCVSAAARWRACARPESSESSWRCLVRPPTIGRASHTRARHLLAHTIASLNKQSWQVNCFGEMVPRAPWSSLRISSHFTTIALNSSSLLPPIPIHIAAFLTPSPPTTLYFRSLSPSLPLSLSLKLLISSPRHPT